MKRLADKSFGVDQWRGIWLRSFLEPCFAARRISGIWSVFIFWAILSSGFPRSYAQRGWGIVDCIQQEKLSIPKVQGRVFDPTGAPIPKALVRLSQDGKLPINLETDQSGRFVFRVQAGTYVLRAQAQGFENTEATLDVGRDVASLFHPKALKVILALPGMNCPWVTTSNREYRQLVRQHATQN